MWIFLLVLILVFAAVDLLVKFVIDPMASKKRKKTEAVNAKKTFMEPSVGLVGATMYDGGKNKDAEESNAKKANENTNGEKPVK